MSLYSPRCRLPRTFLLAAALALTVPAQGAPPDGARFKDWGTRCEALPEGKGQLCHIYQTVSVKDKDKPNDQPLLNVAVLYPPGKDTPLALFTVPLGVLLPAGMGLQVDEGETTRFGYELCMPQGCRGGLELKPEVIEALKRGKQAKVIVVDAKRRAAAIPVSLQGFTAAFDSLK
ncbi:MAG TPA: invasion associated locus B family protein [Thiobacillaceae bacterium]|nr:invasion associated locus B family protein [Thiobacillaceae bacterium]